MVLAGQLQHQQLLEPDLVGPFCVLPCIQLALSAEEWLKGVFPVFCSYLVSKKIEFSPSVGTEPIKKRRKMLILSLSEGAILTKSHQ